MKNADHVIHVSNDRIITITMLQFLFLQRIKLFLTNTKTNTKLMKY